MSGEMRERIECVYEAINRGDFDAAIDALEPVDPDIVWLPLPTHPIRIVSIRGRDGVKKRIMELAAPFEKRDGRVVEFRRRGNRTFVDAHLRGEGIGSKVPFDGHLYQVVTSRNPGETITRVDNFLIAPRPSKPPAFRSR